jgi:hypothetical protein
MAKVNNLVLVKFTEKCDGFFKGTSLEYPEYSVLLFFNVATKKKKTYSWKKIVYLNKPMVAICEEIENNIIHVSLAYLSDIFPKSYSFEEIQKTLLNIFSSNDILKNHIKNYDKENYTKIYNELTEYIDIHKSDITISYLSLIHI